MKIEFDTETRKVFVNGKEMEFFAFNHASNASGMLIDNNTYHDFTISYYSNDRTGENN